MSDLLSPSGENGPADIATLMATDPLNLTNLDIERLIEHFRGARKIFNVQKAAPRATARTVRTGAQKTLGIVPEDVGGVNL